MGTLRTLALLLSPRFFAGRLTNLYFLWRVRRTAACRKVLQSYFDAGYYLSRYPDVASTKVNPLWHYVLQGSSEGRSPSSRFNARDYLRQYPDVARARINPLLHYARYGRGENRKTRRSPGFALGASNDVRQDKRAILQNTQWPAGSPLVSVVLACSHCWAQTERAIRSVLSQTFSSLELIVMGDGGTDTEAERKCRELEELSGRRILFLPPNEGRPSRNQVISTVRGRYVSCVDADDRLRPVYLEVAAFLAEGYGYHLVYPSAPNLTGSVGKGLLAEACFPEIREVNPIFGGALFRKDAWTGIGGYHEGGPRQASSLEDWDFCVRLLEHGDLAKGIEARSLLYEVRNGSLTGSREPRTDHQVSPAHAALLGEAMEGEPVAPRVMNPWINLQGKADDKPGFVLALPFITLGGSETLLQSISRTLVDRGWRVIVITTLDAPATVKDYAASFEAITPHVYPLPLLFEQNEERWEAFLRYLLVHYNASTIMIAGCEFVYRVLPAIRREFPDLRIVDQLFNDEVHLPNNRTYAQHIDVTVVPSQGFAETLLNRYRESPERVAVIPHGVSTKGPELEDRAAAFGASGLPASAQNKFLVSFFGRLSQEKAPDAFVEIAQQLREQNEIYFCMTGDGPLRPAVLDLIKRYGLQDKIYAPGFVEDARILMELSDVVVVPSRIDGMPLVVLEAQALGKPVVASAVGSIPEMIADSESGFLCAPGDVQAFSMRVLELLRSPQKRKEIGAVAQEAVRRRHDLETMMAAYMRVFRGIQQVGA